MDVSIVIVNYNTYNLTLNCIKSVFEKTSGIKYEVILVDNASKEVEEKSFEDQFPAIKVIRLAENKGFAGGNNAGLPYAKGKYILLLNSDTILIENSIAATFKYLEDNPKAGVVSARLIFPDGRYQSVAQRFPSIKYKLVELFRLQKLLSKEFSGKYLLGSFFDHNKSVIVDWVWGAYFMFRKDLLDQMHGNKLDDSYFMYAEDMQWCWDIRKLGYEIHYCADTTVVHLMGGSSANKKDLMHNSGEEFFLKNYHPISKWGIKKLQTLLQRH